MRRRAYTRTSAAAGSPDVPAGMLAIFNRAGRLLGLAWHISEAQAMARGIDAYYQALRGLPIPGEQPTDQQLAEQVVRISRAIPSWKDAHRQMHPPAVWQRGPIARRYRGHVVKIEQGNQ